MKPKILISDPIDDEAIQELRKFAEVDIGKEKLKEIEKYDCLIVRSATKVTEELIRRGKNLKIIARAGVGMDNIDQHACTSGDRKIVLVNAPDSLTYAVAELTIGLILAFLRKICEADKSMKEGKWEKNKFNGIELRGKTLGIIGFGRIGREVARLASSFNMDIVAYDPYVKVTEKYVRQVELEELLKISDIVSLHIPLTETTKHLINKEKLKLLKNTALLVNTSRGGIIEESALIDALKEKRILGACLDVFENEPNVNKELLKLDNVILTPHIGSLTKEAQKRAGMTIAEKIRDYFMGQI